jgi:Xaa-Pro aminopeptidase
MRQAANITTDAHIALMKGSKEPGASELTMHALFEYVCFKGGAPVQAYMPIVAFGRNGAVLHYVFYFKNLTIIGQKRCGLLG